MDETRIATLRTGVISIGRLLWEKDLAGGLNGNISVRVDGERMLITATKTCLGLLQEKDVLLAGLDGRPLVGGELSCETPLHSRIYEEFPDVHAVIHTHTTVTNAYFLHRDVLEPRIFEARIYLGEVRGVPQHSPMVTDLGPVIEALRLNKIVALQRHGVVAVGADLFDGFLLIQGLEEAVKIDAIGRLYASDSPPPETSGEERAAERGGTKTYRLFSEEQIAEIVRLVNADAELQEMGRSTGMTMELAVKWDETGTVYSFRFVEGRIASVGRNEDAEFLISAPEAVWRAVFNGEIDPFVATTQKKMHLRGDFGRISRWYAPCRRIFQLWRQVPVD